MIQANKLSSARSNAMRVDSTALFRVLSDWAERSDQSDRQTGETLLAMMHALVRFDDIVIFAYRDKARPLLSFVSAYCGSRSCVTPGRVFQAQVSRIRIDGYFLNMRLAIYASCRQSS